MPTPIITTKLEPAHLAEIYQSMTLKLAILRPNGDNSFERITPFVLCRDFLTDVYTFSKANLDFGIYGMHFKGSKEKPDYNNILLLAKFPNTDTKTTFLGNLSKLHTIEGSRKNQITLTTPIELSESELIIFADGAWLRNCLTFSLYTYLLRALCYVQSNVDDWIVEFGNKNQATDAAYAKSVHPSTWQRIFTDLSSIDTPDFCGFEVALSNLHKIHSNSGFISVFGSHREINREAVKQNTHWALMKERGFELNTK